MLIIVFTIVFVLIGAALFAFGIAQRNKAKAAQAWPTAPGVILASGLDQHTSYDSDRGSSTTYAPQVQYQYDVMGSTYTGNQLAFGNASYDYRTASKRIAPYPQGAQVTVHYDPANPANAVLETKASGSVILLVLGVIFAGIGLVIGVTCIVH
jgi:hypothetical protein